MFASLRGHLDTVMEHGADPLIENKVGVSTVNVV